MNRPRLLTVLLSLGVLVGFGSAFAHFGRGRDHADSWGWHRPCRSYDERAAVPKPEAND
jgi:hypothetical protein